MIGSGLYIRFSKDLTNLSDGIRIGNAIIPEHLIKKIDEKQKSVVLYSGWNLKEQGEEFWISYHKLVIRLNAKFIECFQTSPRL